MKQFDAKLGHVGSAIYSVVSNNKSIFIVLVVKLAVGFLGHSTVAVKVCAVVMEE